MKTDDQAQIFRNRLEKIARHLRRWPSRGVTCFRLYDHDIPEVPLKGPSITKIGSPTRSATSPPVPVPVPVPVPESPPAFAPQSMIRTLDASLTPLCV